MVADIPDEVTYTNFGDHRFRGFWVAGGQISLSPIDFHRRPYNTLALPCERVIPRALLFACGCLYILIDVIALLTTSFACNDYD